MISYVVAVLSVSMAVRVGKDRRGMIGDGRSDQEK